VVVVTPLQDPACIIEEPRPQGLDVGWLQRCELHVSRTTHDGGLPTSPRTRTFMTSQDVPSSARPTSSITPPIPTTEFDGISRENGWKEELVVLCVATTTD